MKLSLKKTVASGDAVFCVGERLVGLVAVNSSDKQTERERDEEKRRKKKNKKKENFSGFSKFSLSFMLNRWSIVKLPLSPMPCFGLKSICVSIVIFVVSFNLTALRHRGKCFVRNLICGLATISTRDLLISNWRTHSKQTQLNDDIENVIKNETTNLSGDSCKNIERNRRLKNKYFEMTGENEK